MLGVYDTRRSSVEAELSIPVWLGSGVIVPPLFSVNSPTLLLDDFSPLLVDVVRTTVGGAFRQVSGITPI